MKQKFTLPLRRHVEAFYTQFKEDYEINVLIKT